MPRIRTIKPELPEDEKLGSVPIEVRWLFVALITQADDHGNLRGSAGYIRSRAFPHDDVATSTVEDWIQALAGLDLVLLYVVNGERYLHLCGWKKHQVVKNPARVYPIPDPSSGDSTETLRTSSGDSTETLRTSSGDSTETLPLARASDLGPRTLDLGSGQSPRGDSSEPAQKPRRSRRQRQTYAAAMRSSNFSTQNLADLLERAASAADLVEGHPFFATIADPQAWAALQLTDRPGIDVQREMGKAARWLHDSPSKAGNKKDAARFLNAWLDRARPGESSTAPPTQSNGKRAYPPNHELYGVPLDDDWWGSEEGQEEASRYLDTEWHEWAARVVGARGLR